MSESIKRVFVQEAAELLDALDTTAFELEAQPDERDLVNQFMRALHTLKGSAATAGCTATADLAHAIEDAMDPVRKGRATLEDRLIDLLFEALDQLRDALATIGFDLSEPIAQLTSTSERMAAWSKDSEQQPQRPNSAPRTSDERLQLGEYDWIRIKVLRKRGLETYRLELELTAGPEQLASCAERALHSMRALGTVVATAPAAAALDQLAAEQPLIAILGSARPVSELQSAALSDEVSAVAITTFSGQPQQKPVIETPVVQSAPTVRVEMATLETVLRLAGELSIQCSRLRGHANDFAEAAEVPSLEQDLEQAADQLRNVALSLQDGIVRARAVPIARLFRRIKRRLHRLQRAIQRPFRWVTAGGETPLDQAVVDAIAEPLIDLTRQLMTTGAARGGNSELTLRLEAEKQGREVALTIGGEDGLSAALLEPIEKQLLLLGARCETRPSSRGAVQLIHLPSSFAIVEALLVQVADELYAFRVEDVVETVKLGLADVETVLGRWTADLRGDAVSLLFLRKALDVPGKSSAEEYSVVVLQQQGQLLGVVVDQLVGRAELMIEPPGRHLAHAPTISGSAIMGDGRVALVLQSRELAAEAIAASNKQALAC